MTTPQEPSTPVRPHVLIVGGGLGGLMLGALLEKANIPYTIFERATTVKPLGAAMSVGGQVMGVFRQLGIYDQYCEIAKPYTLNIAVKETGEKMLEMDYGIAEEICGYQNFIVPRPLFHNLLLKQVPPSKILYGKRVHAIDQDDEKVRIETTDGSTYEGDILVGADGAYSGVRQQLYEALLREGRLPEPDQEDLPFSCTCLVGQTESLDLEVFYQLKDQNYPFVTTMCDDKPFMFTLYSTAQGTICWMVIRFHDVRSTKAAQERKYRRDDNSEWGPVAAQVMSDETKDIPITLGNGGMTLADIYNRTPKDRMSMVMLEEKLFQTWYHGRTVLLGDACHKLHPSGGQGAITAMHDAIALANLLYALPSNTSEAISKTFAEYHAERYPPAVAAFNGSQLLSEIRNKGLVGTMTLSLSFERYMLLWVWRVILVSVVKNRPYIGFLPKVEEKKGAEPASKSPSAQKARAMYKKRKGGATTVIP
ncbi:MAG: hypothetical protein J3R72DRAFT_451256 [Linnemannia gamsii]|nr:MAG: hypothetical protein J3R72DRAFT_451256 [Linnemannia gamsii]